LLGNGGEWGEEEDDDEDEEETEEDETPKKSCTVKLKGNWVLSIALDKVNLKSYASDTEIMINEAIPVLANIFPSQLLQLAIPDTCVFLFYIHFSPEICIYHRAL